MIYTLKMDMEDARWIVDVLKRMQLDTVSLKSRTQWTEQDVERAQSFISRIRAMTKRA